MTNTCKWVPKGWGGEKWIVNNDKYCGKLLYFMKDKKCSFHYHKNKDETFYVHKGQVEVCLADIKDVQVFVDQGIPDAARVCGKWYTLCQGDTLHIPVGTVHQIYATEDTELFEFSTHHEDEDSYRIIKGD